MAVGVFSLLVLGTLLVLLAVFAVSVLLPLVALLIFVGGFLYARARARLWWSGLRAPNGAIDGRRNVRVRMPPSD